MTDDRRRHQSVKPALRQSIRWIPESRRGSWYLALSGLFVTAFLFPLLPTSLDQDWVQFTIGLASVVVILFVALGTPSHDRGKWLLFASSGFLFFLGDTVWLVYNQILHLPVPFPSIADAFYIAGYPFFFLALRSTFASKDGTVTRIDVIDSAVVALSAFAMLWPILIGPYLHDNSVSTFGVVVNVTYPMMDLVLIFLTIRYAVFRGSVVPFRSLILASIVVMSVADIGFDWLSFNNHLGLIRYANAGYILQYELLALAAWRSRAADVSQNHLNVEVSASPIQHRSYRIVVLIGVGLIPALVYIVSTATHATVNGPLMAGLSCAVFVLIGLRMSEITRRLQHDSLHDHLTSLPNRAYLEMRLAEATGQFDRYRTYGAVIEIDLDDFKSLNDSLGHAFGDKLLIAVGQRLKDQLRGNDAVYRIGGDEFVCLALELKESAEVDLITQRLSRAFVEPFLVDGISIDQDASIGSYYWDDCQVKSGEALVRADLALYEAKKSFSRSSCIFTPRLQSAALDRFALLQDLRHAIAAGELSMYFQPIVDLHRDVPVGFEALMRWNHPSRGMVPPDEFIPLAEQSNLIHELGQFALGEAIRVARSWPPVNMNGTAPYVTVNLSSNQFQDPKLIDNIRQTLAQHGLPPSRLVMEITEGVALQDIDQTKRLVESMRDLGVRVALDDFGTGHSSLSVLVDLRPAIVKVDQSFVRPIKETSESDAILESIVTLCRKLNMVVLAEGIETVEKEKKLKSLKCDLGQGYRWAPAMPANDVASFLATKFATLSQQSV